eukprot:TRINITY_DN857_c1_g1_i6.p2 TRINITY_DN857_c1_g1~~TRINITY_DN857_c1_g1_i6.p2  ORF type:complete len:1092 (+),score=420.92 TRINITY_DN857_c1_g1_i6:3324-6599(+)
MEDECAATKSKLSAMEEQVQSWKKRSQELEKAQKDDFVPITTHERVVEELIRWKNDCNSLSERTKSLEADTVTKSEENARTTQRFETDIRRRDATIQELTTKCKELEDRSLSLKEENQRLSVELDGMKESHDIKDMQGLQLKEEVDRLRKEYQDTKSKHIEASDAHVLQREELERLQMRNEELDTEISELQESFKVMESERNDVMHRLESELLRSQRLIIEKTELHGMYDRIVREKDAIKNLLDSLLVTLEGLERKAGVTSRELDAMCADNHRMMKELESSVDECRQLKEVNESLRMNMMDARLAETRGEDLAGEMRIRVQQLEKEKEGLKRSLEQMQDELLEQKDINRSQREEYQTQMDEMEKENQELVEKMTAAHSEMGQLQYAAQSGQDRISRIIDEQRRTIASLHDRIEAYEEEKRNMIEEHANREASLQEIQREFERLERSAKEKHLSLERALRQAVIEKTGVSSRLAACESNMKETRESMEHATKELDQVTVERDDLQSRLTRVEKELEKIKENKKLLDEPRSSSSAPLMDGDDDIGTENVAFHVRESTQMKISEMETRLTLLADENASLRSENDSLVSDRERIRSEMGAARRENFELRSRVGELEDEVKERQNDVETLSQSLKRVNDESNQHARELREAMEQRESKFSAQIISMRERISREKEQVSLLTTHLEKLQREKEELDLKDESIKRKVQSLETRVQELEEERKVLKSSHASLEDVKEKNRIDISDREMEISKLQEKLKKMKENGQKMEEALKEVNKKKEELVSECEKLRLENSTLGEQLQGMESGYSSSSMEFEKKLEDTNRRLDVSMKEKESLRKTMNQELEKVTRERDDALEQIDDFQGRERRYKLAYENLRMRMQMEHSSWKRHVGLSLMHVGDAETQCVDTLRKIDDGVRKCEQTFSAWEAGHRKHVLSLQMLSSDGDASSSSLSWKEECGRLASQELSFCEKQTGVMKEILIDIGLEKGRKDIMNVLSSLRETLESVPEDIVFSTQEEFDERTSGMKKDTEDGKKEEASMSTFTPSSHAARSTPLSSLLRDRMASSSTGSRFSLQRQQSTPVGLGRNLLSPKSSFASPSSRSLI